VADCKLTGGLTHKDRRGTLIDWNLCFNAHGQSTERNFKSGTPAFMAPILFEDERLELDRRTLGHDMESFFAVIIWMASLNHTDEVAFKAKPLVIAMLDKKKTPVDMVRTKEDWFYRPKVFKNQITDYFEPAYGNNIGFVECLFKLRSILYQDGEFDFAYEFGGLDNRVTENGDPMKEGLFRQCMKEMDDYLDDTKGCSEMEWIDSKARA